MNPEPTSEIAQPLDATTLRHLTQQLETLRRRLTEKQECCAQLRQLIRETEKLCQTIS